MLRRKALLIIPLLFHQPSADYISGVCMHPHPAELIAVIDRSLSSLTGSVLDACASQTLSACVRGVVPIVENLPDIVSDTKRLKYQTSFLYRENYLLPPFYIVCFYVAACLFKKCCVSCVVCLISTLFVVSKPMQLLLFQDSNNFKFDQFIYNSIKIYVTR